MNTQLRDSLAKQLEATSENINNATHMLAESANCMEVLQRLRTAHVALDQIKTELLRDYIERWTNTLIQSNNIEQCEELLKEFPILFNSIGMTNTAYINPQRGEKSMTTVNYFIPSINCGGCKSRIETWLNGVEGVQSVQVDVPTKRAIVTFDKPATDEVLKEFLLRVNYPVQESTTLTQPRSCCG